MSDDWQILNAHLEGLCDLFRKGKKYIQQNFIYNEGISESTIAQDKKKKKSAPKVQKLQRAAEPGL